MSIKRVQNSFIVIFLIFVCVSHIYGQKNQCQGAAMMTEKSCQGDEIVESEKLLFQLINDYRRQNNLPAVTLSQQLSVLANRHLLDLQYNLKKTTHSWSDCPYDLNNPNSWNCITDAPGRLKIGYGGQGFENLYRSFDGNPQPQAILEAWKKSDLHNSLILNLKSFAATKFDALGVAISGEYASIWFGTQNSDLSGAFKSGGLGITYEEMVKNLNKVIAIEKSASIAEEDIWSGFSKDKAVFMEVEGKTTNVLNARISLKIKLVSGGNLTVDKRRLVSTFVDNVFGSSPQNESWINENLLKLNLREANFRGLIKDGKIIQIAKSSQNQLILTAEPYKNQKNEMTN